MQAMVICDTMVCPPARGDNPRALVSGLSIVHVDTSWYNINTNYSSVDLAHFELFRGYVGKGRLHVSCTSPSSESLISIL